MLLGIVPLSELLDNSLEGYTVKNISYNSDIWVSTMLLGIVPVRELDLALLI